MQETEDQTHEFAMRILSKCALGSQNRAINKDLYHLTDDLGYGFTDIKLQGRKDGAKRLVTIGSNGIVTNEQPWRPLTNRA